MASDEGPPESDMPENVLFEWYRRYIGPPDEDIDVYAGFALFIGGIGLAVVGVVTFLWTSVSTADPAFVYALREFAAVCGAAGLPLLLLGVTVLLPVDRRATYAAVGGTAVCLVAVAMFVSAYPVNWNVPGPRDASGQVVAVYAVGIVGVVAATGAALVGHHIERARPTVTSEAAGAADADAGDDEGESISEEEIRSDIEGAMSETDISWGGIEKMDTKRLKLDLGDVDEVDASGFEGVEATTVRAAGEEVDDAVAGLKGLKGEGREAKTARSTQTTDDQAAALSQLREQKRQEAEQDPDGVLDRVLSRIRD